MHVVATAGHVDHGKSTLVRALTGTDPDRFAEEKRRGLTIELGYAWTTLPGREELLAFVDVPGHHRFIGTMLAGLGPAPAVLFVVAADEGWRRQSGEHLAAVDALGLRHGLLVITRSDLADPAAAREQAKEQIARSSLSDVRSVAVSARTGQGLDDLRPALAELVDALPAPRTDAPLRLWVDRSFAITGAGTVVTGTLGAGRIAVGDELRLDGRRVVVRGLQSAERSVTAVSATARVAVNLRAVDHHDVGRGDVLLGSGWGRGTDTVDVRLRAPLAGELGTLPAELLLHAGTASVPVRVRRLGQDTARLALTRQLPLVVGDRAILRDPGPQRIAAAVEVLDADPPSLRRRGAARDRAAVLGESKDVDREIDRRGAVTAGALRDLGLDPAAASARRIGEWLISTTTWLQWTRHLADVVDRLTQDDPLADGVTRTAAVRSVGLPDAGLLDAVVAGAGLETVGGRVRRPGYVPTLGAAEPAVQRIEQRLAEHPFAAPEKDALGLDARQLAVAVRTGRLIELPDAVVLAPDGPARAMRILAALPQPFTTSEARQALGTTRRVAIPLLEHLDARGWTRRLDAGHREVARPLAPDAEMV